MSVTNEFKGSKPYRIVNNFEHTIKNFIRIITSHAEVFMKTLSKVSESAENNKIRKKIFCCHTNLFLSYLIKLVTF